MFRFHWEISLSPIAVRTWEQVEAAKIPVSVIFGLGIHSKAETSFSFVFLECETKALVTNTCEMMKKIKINLIVRGVFW